MAPIHALKRMYSTHEPNLAGRDDFHVVRYGETGCVEGGRDRARPYPHDWVHGLHSCAEENTLYP